MGASAEPPVLQALSSNPGQFLKPAFQLHSDSLASAKHFLDPVAFGISQEQQSRKKRKKTDSAANQPTQLLRLQEVHVDGFTPQQVWEQAQRVLRSCGELTGEAAVPAADNKPDATHSYAEASSDDDEIDQLYDVGSDPRTSDEEMEGMENDDADDDDDNQSLARSDIHSSVNNEEDGDEIPAGHSQAVSHPDRFGLNDGFFSIDEFNKQTAFFEHQDNKNTTADGDDDEDLDWHADPFGPAADDLELDEEDEGPEDQAEENIDEHSELDELDMDSEVALDSDGEDPRNIRYDEFFDQPSLDVQGIQKKPSKQSKKPELRETEDNVDNEIDRAMSDVRRDLFDDESDQDDDDSAVESDRNAVSLKGLSTHEQRRAKLADEMRKLEAANVAKKDWALSGEAKGADRPHNALLEEQLEFEHVGKPVPVITADITEDIEARIKQRIIAKEFDDIIRRHPLATGEQGGTKRGKFELEDSKPQQGLAELYETDHMRATDPGFVDVKDAKLKKEHHEIKQLWDNISSQLDTLSNWHYRPKTPAANINVVQDVDTITMEDVRPSGAGGAGTSAMLAPQEVYAPGDDGKNQKEVVLQSGAAMAKDEMTREAKLRRRRREKQKLKKAGSRASKPEGSAGKQQQVVSDLKKGNVKVVGKEGRLNDVQGRDVGSSTGKGRKAALKL